MEVDVDDSGTAGKRGGNEAINYNTGEMEDGGLGERDEDCGSIREGVAEVKRVCGYSVDGRGRTIEIVRAIKSYKDIV